MEKAYLFENTIRNEVCKIKNGNKIEITEKKQLTKMHPAYIIITVTALIIN